MWGKKNLKAWIENSLTVLGRWDVFFYWRVCGSKDIGYTARCLGDMGYAEQTGLHIHFQISDVQNSWSADDFEVQGKDFLSHLSQCFRETGWFRIFRDFGAVFILSSCNARLKKNSGELHLPRSFWWRYRRLGLHVLKDSDVVCVWVGGLETSAANKEKRMAERTDPCGMPAGHE